MLKSNCSAEKPMPYSLSSFVNGLIAGAGITLALMSYGFMKFTSSLENIQGVTSTELRIAILLGGMVAAVSIGYEFYTKKDKVQQTTKDTEIIEELPKVSEHDKIDIKESKTEDSENSEEKSKV